MDREHFDRDQFDLAAPLQELCQQACRRDDGCWAYVYAEPGLRSDRARCFLKDVAPAGVPRAGYLSGVKTVGQWEVGIDRNGSDIRGAPFFSPTTAADPNDCRRQCDPARGCWAFAYDGANHQCWLKSVAPRASADRPEVVSGVVAFGAWRPSLDQSEVAVLWSATTEAVCSAGGTYRANFSRDRRWDLRPGWGISGNRIVGNGQGFASLDSVPWSDFAVSFHVKLNRDTLHLNYRHSAGQRYIIGLQENHLYLQRQAAGGRPQDVADAGVRLPLGQWHLVQVVGRGGDIRVFVDGVEEMRFRDSRPLRGGSISFEVLRNSSAEVTDVAVCPQ